MDKQVKTTQIKKHSYDICICSKKYLSTAKSAVKAQGKTGTKQTQVSKHQIKDYPCL